MLRTTAFANAMTTVWEVAYIVCTLVAYLFPSFYTGIKGTWIHATSVQMGDTLAPFNFGSFFIGFITFGAVVWVMSYAFVVLYNRFVR